jgi:PAS domain S-box-containing protein
VKIALRDLFDPAVQLMNRLSYPRKFAAAGMLFALPLVFVTSQYIAMLNERVEISQRELAGNRAVRVLVPLWQALCEHRRLLTQASIPRDASLIEANRRFLDKLDFRLKVVLDSDEEIASLFASSARWATLQSKLQSLLNLAGEGNPGLYERSLLTELIRDLVTVFKQLADLSNLTTDSHLDSQSLALVTTRLLPELVEAEDRLWELVHTSEQSGAQGFRVDLEAADALVSLCALQKQAGDGLRLAKQRNEDLISRLEQPQAVFQASLDSVRKAMRERLRTSKDQTDHSDTELLDAGVVNDIFGLHGECLNSFDVVVGRRCEAARFRRMYLILTALLPVVLAVYLGIGFCLAVIRTVDRMREVTDRALANDWRGNDIVPVEAQDELGHMIGDFGRLTVRLREEWAAANAEAARASDAEESLRVSEERFSLALRGTNDGIWDWDLKTDHVFYSIRFKELLGYGDEEFGVWLSALADVLHPDDFDDTWTAVERHLHERIPYHIEHRLRTKSGVYRWYLERGQAVWDEDGNAVRMAGSISDINERRVIEAHERVRNSVMEALTTGAPLSDILEVLVHGLEQESHTRAISILLLDREGRRLLTGAAPSLPGFYNAAIHGIGIGPGVGSCGTAVYLRERVIVEDIQQHPYWAPYKELAARAGLASCWSQPIFGESSNVIGTFAIYDTKVSRPSAADILFIEAAAKVAGVAIERKQTEEERRQYLQQVEESRDRIAEQSVQLIRQSEELARAKDEAEAAARAKSEFLANMSHELRTPLTAILGYADLLYEEGDLSLAPLNSLETIDVIRSNGRHLQELIDDILDLSKIEAGRMTLEKLQVAPANLMEDVLRLMQLRAREKSLTLKSEILYPLPDKIATDALRVRQVLVNLVGNAIKFTELGGVTVTIGYDQAAGCLRFAVTDTGIGMEPQQVERLFAPFAQADTSMSRRFGGTGLGLSISMRLARMLGGNIRVDSRPGVGSTFTLEIAAELYSDTVLLTGDATTASSRSLMSRSVAKPTSNLSGRILLAEDVPANQKLISFLLQKNGAEVAVVENGRLAIDQALAAQRAGTPFDLILMDIQMPIMDGYMATSALRDAGYGGRIVALTAHATEDDRYRCLDSGFDGFAVKPIQKEQLLATCREHLGQALPQMADTPAAKL